LRESVKVNVAPVTYFPLTTLRRFSNLFGKLTTDYQQISRARVVVSFFLVVRCLAGRACRGRIYPTHLFALTGLGSWTGQWGLFYRIDLATHSIVCQIKFYESVN